MFQAAFVDSMCHENTDSESAHHARSDQSWNEDLPWSTGELIWFWTDSWTVGKNPLTLVQLSQIQLYDSLQNWDPQF